MASSGHTYGTHTQMGQYRLAALSLASLATSPLPLPHVTPRSTETQLPCQRAKQTFEQERAVAEALDEEILRGFLAHLLISKPKL